MLDWKKKRKSECGNRKRKSIILGIKNDGAMGFPQTEWITYISHHRALRAETQLRLTTPGLVRESTKDLARILAGEHDETTGVRLRQARKTGRQSNETSDR